MSDTISDSAPQKQCSKCKNFLPATFEFFFRQKHGKYGLRSICKSCIRITGVEPPPLGTMKRCSKCREWKPATTDFFARSRNRHDGLQHRCKICLRRASDPSIYEIPQGYKRCASCKETFPATTDFFHVKKMKDGVYGLTGRCIPCGNSVSRQYYHEHAEALGLYRKEYYAQHRDACLNYAQLYREGNSEKLRKWRQDNIEIVRAYCRNRQARKKTALGTHTHKDILAQYERQHGQCYYCAKKVGKKYHVDHVVPLSRGGSNSPENLVIACPRCNQSKNDKLLYEWIEGGRLL